MPQKGGTDMARTNRVHKKEVPQGTENAKTAVEKVYRVALYVRLSVLDSGKKDSDTVETHELLLRRFIEGKPYFSLFLFIPTTGKPVWILNAMDLNG